MTMTRLHIQKYQFIISRTLSSFSSSGDKRVPSRAPWLEGNRTTHGSFPSCLQAHPPAHKADHQYILSGALATSQLQQLCSSPGWVSPLLPKVRRASEMREVTTQHISLSLRSNQVSFLWPDPHPNSAGTGPGPTCQNHWICLLFLV